MDSTTEAVGVSTLADNLTTVLNEVTATPFTTTTTTLAPNATIVPPSTAWNDAITLILVLVVIIVLIVVLMTLIIIRLERAKPDIKSTTRVRKTIPGDGRAYKSDGEKMTKSTDSAKKVVLEVAKSTGF